jgi:hypothetical protein
VSNTKRRTRRLRSAAARATVKRRTAGARAAAALSAQASETAAVPEASARAGARFIVIERTGRGRQDDESDRPFMVVEAETRQIPENFFGRDWTGLHSTRESADAEAGELNALAGHFLVATEPVVDRIAPAPVMADLAPVLGKRATAWESLVLAPTAEMPVISDEDDEPSRLPGAENLRAVVDEIAHRPHAPAGQSTGERYAHVLRAAGWEPPASGAKLDDLSARAFEEGFGKDTESADGPAADSPRGPVDGGRWREHRDIAQHTLQLPRITDAVHTSRPGRDSPASPIIPGLHRALIHEIRAGEQVLCTDGSWRTTAGGSLREGVAILVMADLTEHAFNADLRFWVRPQPPAAAAGLHHRPTCPNGCFRTQADYRLCTCNWGCGCSPHPPQRPARTDTREFLLAGAVA